jgi:hypothetical protein
MNISRLFFIEDIKCSKQVFYDIVYHLYLCLKQHKIELIIFEKSLLNKQNR